jgi:hypothetical protein
MPIADSNAPIVVGIKRHEQRNQNDHRDRAARVGDVARDGCRREHEDDGQADQQNVQRDLVRRLLPLGALHQLDHAIEERRSWGRGDADHDPVGNHGRPASDGRAIAAGLADHRRRFTRHGGFVDRSDTLDHLTITGNDVASFADNKIACLKLISGHALIEFGIVRRQKPLGAGFRASLRAACRLAPSRALGHGFGEVGEKHGEP